MNHSEQLSNVLHRRTPKLPTTSRLPLVGSLPQLMRRQCDFLTETHRTHGDIFTMNLGPLTLTALNTPEQAKHILVDNAKNYTKGSPLWAALRTLLGNGLPVSEGDFWLKQRRMVQPHFHKRHLVRMTDAMIEAIQQHVVSWDGACQRGEPISMYTEVESLVVDVVSRSLFGTRISPEDADIFVHEMSIVMKNLAVALFTHKIPQWVPIPGRKRYAQALATVDDILFRLLDEQRNQEQTDGGAGRAKSSGADWISMLYDMVDAETGERINHQELRDEVVGIFGGGYETSLNAISFLFHFISQQPEVAQKVTDEVDSVIGDRLPTFADLSNLAYTKMAVQEAMRLYPTVFYIPRTAVDDDEIDGYHIKAGSDVGAVVYNIQRHPAIWDEPDKFIPERFAADRVAKRHKLAWMPFGAGQRQCIGKEFALIEGTFSLAQTMQRYQVEAVSTKASAPTMGVNLAIKDDVWVKLKRR